MSFLYKVQVYKDESTAGGGSASNAEPFPTTIIVTQEAVECCGVVLNDYHSGSPIQDQNVTLQRSSNDMILADVTNGSQKLSALAKTQWRRSFFLMGA